MGVRSKWPLYRGALDNYREGNPYQLSWIIGLQGYRQLVWGRHVRVLVDNTTVQVIANKMGTSHSTKLNFLVKTIWDWSIAKNIWLTVAWIPGKENIEADTEWCLFFISCAQLCFTPNLDLFASQINYQVKPYISYHPDLEAFAVNAFHLTWSNYKFYAFPPFNIMSLVIQKIRKEQSDRILVIPKWPTQIWWPVAVKMLVQAPVVLPATERTLYLPSHSNEKHQLHQKPSLLMCHLSGNNSKTEAFLQQVPITWKHLGDQGPEGTL